MFSSNDQNDFEILSIPSWAIEKLTAIDNLEIVTPSVTQPDKPHATHVLPSDNLHTSLTKKKEEINLDVLIKDYVLQTPNIDFSDLNKMYQYSLGKIIDTITEDKITDEKYKKNIIDRIEMLNKFKVTSGELDKVLGYFKQINNCLTRGVLIKISKTNLIKKLGVSTEDLKKNLFYFLIGITGKDIVKCPIHKVPLTYLYGILKEKITFKKKQKTVMIDNISQKDKMIIADYLRSYFVFKVGGDSCIKKFIKLNDSLINTIQTEVNKGLNKYNLDKNTWGVKKIDNQEELYNNKKRTKKVTMENEKQVSNKRPRQMKVGDAISPGISTTSFVFFTANHSNNNRMQNTDISSPNSSSLQNNSQHEVRCRSLDLI